MIPEGRYVTDIKDTCVTGHGGWGRQGSKTGQQACKKSGHGVRQLPKACRAWEGSRRCVFHQSLAVSRMRPSETAGAFAAFACSGPSWCGAGAP